MATQWGRPRGAGFRPVFLLWAALCAGPALEACLLPEGSVHPGPSGECSNPRCGCRHKPGETCSCPCCSAGRDGAGDEAPVACSCYAGSRILPLRKGSRAPPRNGPTPPSPRPAPPTRRIVQFERPRRIPAGSDAGKKR